MWKLLLALCLVLPVISCAVETPVADTPTTTQVANPDAAVVQGLLAKVVVLPALAEVPGYERSCREGKACVFGPAWTDTERTGCDTRNRVLGDQLTDVVFKRGTSDCKVVSGTLHDPYSGALVQFTSGGTSKIEIDHVYALARAWDAGAAHWTYEQRVRFANDTDNLLAVTKTENRVKSDSGPGEWMPHNHLFACQFVLKYLAVAARYQLAITDSDRDASVAACANPTQR